MKWPALSSVITCCVLFLVPMVTGPVTHPVHAGDAMEYSTKNIIIVVVDGIRDTEAFSYNFQPGETEHPYIPFIWNNLKPKGTAYMEMYNNVCTFTSAGHAALMSGDWQVSANYHLPVLQETFQTRSWAPTIFEYARKAHPEFDADTIWCVVGNLQCIEANWSVHPAYGKDFGASLVHEPVENTPKMDFLTVDAAIEIIDTYHPAILLVNLKGVDIAGHTVDWNDYLKAIKFADWAVERLWNTLMVDPNYRDRTTFIVTTDHGRHDIIAPYNRGFWGHSGICRGCRHVMCLIVGPDTPRNQEISRTTYQVDILPTIGEIYNLDTPYSRGQVLREAVTGYGEKKERRIMKEPAIDVDDNRVFVTWSDNRTGSDEIYCITSNDYGQTFGDTVQLSTSNAMAIQPSVAVDGENVHVVWLDFKNDEWELLYMNSTDSGYHWEPEITLESSVEEIFNEETQRETMSRWLWNPSILFEGDEGAITFTKQNDSLAILRTSDGGSSWNPSTIASNTEYPANLNGCLIGFDVGTVWCDQMQEQGYNNWEIYFSNQSGEKTLLSINPIYSIQPSIGSDGFNTTGVAWADNRDCFRVYFRNSTDGGTSWSPKREVTGSDTGAWQPKLAWIPGVDAAHLVWTDYRDGQGELYYNYYEQGTWEMERRLTHTAEGSVNLPDIAVDDNGHVFMAWEVVTDDSVYIQVGNPINP